MDLLTIFKALRARSFSLHVLQKKLRLENADTGRGWDGTLKKYEKHISENQDMYGNDLTDQLAELYKNHLFYGTKAVVTAFSFINNYTIVQ